MVNESTDLGPTRSSLELAPTSETRHLARLLPITDQAQVSQPRTPQHIAPKQSRRVSRHHVHPLDAARFTRLAQTEECEDFALEPLEAHFYHAHGPQI